MEVMNMVKAIEMNARDVRKAVEHAGGMEPLGQLLGVSRTTIRNWSEGKYKVAQDRVEPLKRILAGELEQVRLERAAQAATAPAPAAHTNGNGHQELTILQRLERLEAHAGLADRLARVEQLLGIA